MINEFKDLKKFYNDIIVKYPNLIFESEDFRSLRETALISILKRDDLKVEEIKISDDHPDDGQYPVPLETDELEVKRDGDERDDDRHEGADDVVRSVTDDAHAGRLL